MNLEHIPRQLQLTRVDVHPSVVDKRASSSHDCISRSMQDAMSPLFWNRKWKCQGNRNLPRAHPPTFTLQYKLKIMCSTTTRTQYLIFSKKRYMKCMIVYTASVLLLSLFGCFGFVVPSSSSASDINPSNSNSSASLTCWLSVGLCLGIFIFPFALPLIPFTVGLSASE